MSNKCEKCGNENNEDSKFCEKCGNSLESNGKTPSNVTSQNIRNEISCPYCGSKIPANVSKCGHCGEWIDRSKSNTLIIIAYIVTFLGIVINIFAYNPMPAAFVLVCIFTLLPPYVITLYLLTRKDSKPKKHGIVLLIILIIFTFLCYIIYLNTVEYYNLSRINRNLYGSYY